MLNHTTFGVPCWNHTKAGLRKTEGYDSKIVTAENETKRNLRYHDADDKKIKKSCASSDTNVSRAYKQSTYQAGKLFISADIEQTMRLPESSRDHVVPENSMMTYGVLIELAELGIGSLTPCLHRKPSMMST